MKRFRRMSFWVVLMVFVTVAGCGEQNSSEGNVKTRIKDLKSIEADCVVTFYAEDGSSYITEQHHSISPLSETIVISADEPGGRFVCKLTGGNFDLTTGADKLSKIAAPMSDRNTTQIILTSIRAGVGAIDEEQQQLLGEPLKIDGQWYQPIKLESTKSISSEQILYRSSDTSIINIVQVTDIKGGGVFTGRGYNYQWFDEINTTLPMKIDVFNSENASSTRHKILRIEYHTVKLY